MRTITAVLLAGALALAGAGCGEDDEGGDAAGGAPPATTETAPPPAATTPPATTTTELEPAKPKRTGTRIELGDSEFGEMLFGPDEQAIYIFERDSEDKTVCYDECAEAWPPVYTKGEPRAGDGVRTSLLGTVKRRDGKLQVTYDGQPLYYYVNEGPGEVRCHNVNLNGGFWWVVGANGKRLP
jgi:predicted lipoprotein with Yx(FWY)xxD motif